MKRTTARFVSCAVVAVAATVGLAGPSTAAAAPSGGYPPAPGDVDLYLVDPRQPDRTTVTRAVANTYENSVAVLLCDTVDAADGALPYGFYRDVPFDDASGTVVGPLWQTRVRDDAAQVRFGRSDDEPLCGAWGVDEEGEARDTLAVRRGNRFFLSSAPSGATRTVVSFHFGRATDQVLVGDWDGDGVDTVALRRGNIVFFAGENADGGGAVATSSYGRASDLAVAGDFTGSGRDTLALRRGVSFLVAAGEPGGRLTTALSLDLGRATDVPVAGPVVRGEADRLGVLRTRPRS